ncbi:MAG: hypothetical protein FVQ83_07355 [Chloroflexi bacterium]|nr:hypothetical protein [Chloroflexota bacterium]
MKNPAGKECSYFYGDYFRGRNKEECRLLDQAGLTWNPGLCSQCPIPDIQVANSCENMQFKPTLQRPLFFLKPQLQIDVYCKKYHLDVKQPRIGCGNCHELPEAFIVIPNDPDTPSRS